MTRSRRLLLSWLCLATLAFPVDRALACAACFGNSDSPMARGMNMGIFALLGVVVCVLGSVAGFFVYLARRSAKVADPTANASVSQPYQT
jgi:hypothetical protein